MEFGVPKEFSNFYWHNEPWSFVLPEFARQSWTPKEVQCEYSEKARNTRDMCHGQTGGHFPVGQSPFFAVVFEGFARVCTNDFSLGPSQLQNKMGSPKNTRSLVFLTFFISNICDSNA